MKKFTLFLFILLSGFILRAQVINENFDASTDFPTDWQKYVKTSSSYYDVILNTSSYYSYSQPNSVKFYTYTASDTLMLVSPEVDFTEESAYKLSCFLRGSTNNQMEIGTMTDPSDLKTYNPIDTIILKSYSYGPCEIYFSPNELTHLVFKRLSGTLYLDDVLVEAVLPYNAKIETITSQDAVLTENSCNYQILVKNIGSSNATMNLSVDTDLDYRILDKNAENEITSIKLDGLTSDTIIVQVNASEIVEGTKEDSFKVKVSVNEDASIEQELTIDFTTYVPFIEVEEGFEDQSLPFAWSVGGADGKVKFYENSYSAFSGECYAQISAASSSDNPSMLISPAIKGYDGDYKLSVQVSGSDDVEIGLITDLNDWSTYTQVSTIVGGGYSYAKSEVIFSDFTNTAFIVFKYVGTSSYNTVKLDEIDIERYRDVEVDLKTGNTEYKSYFGKYVNYPVYVYNKGKIEGIFNINVNSSWAYKVLAKDLSTEITQITVPNDELDTLYIQIQIPETGIISGVSQVADVKVSVSSDADNFEEVQFTTKAYAPITYLNEGFEESRDLPLNWMAYTSKTYSSESFVKVVTGTVYEGENCVYISHKSDLERPTFLVTPVIWASEEAYTFSFYARAFNTTMNAEIGYFTDPSDTTTYHLIKTVECINEYKQFVIENIVLTESAALTISTSSEGSLYMDNFLIEQAKTNVDFSVNEGDELPVVNPELFVNFSKPVQGIGNVELTNDNIADYIELREESLTGEIVAVNYDISDNLQMIKITAANDLDGITYHLIVNDQLIDVNGTAVEKASVSFTVKDDILPAFVAGYPVTENIGETSFDIKLQSTENSTMFYILVPDGATAPSADEIIAGVNYGSVSIIKKANGELIAKTNAILTVDELEGKVYDLYLTLKDRAGNIQTEVTELDVELLDLTAPEFNNGYPVIENMGETTFDIKAQANEAGKVYYILVDEGSDAPNAEQLMLAADYGSVTVISSGSKTMEANTDLTFNIVNLESVKGYDVYMTLEDNAGNINELVEKLNANTLDLTAPEFITDYPMIEAITATGFEIKVQSIEAGTAYYMLLANDATAPTASEIKAGGDFGLITVLKAGIVESKTEEETIVSITELNSNTEYDLYLTIEDDQYNLQETISKIDVKTLMSTSIEDFESKMEIYPNPATSFVKINSIENIENYSLLNLIGNVVRSGKGNGTSEIINISNLNSGVYFLTVKTVSGKEKVEKIVIK